MKRWMSIVILLALLSPSLLYASRGGGGQVFDASNYLTAAITETQLNLTNAGLTIGGWVKFTSASAANTMLEWADSPSARYLFDFRGSTTQIIKIFSTDINASTSFGSVATITDTLWHWVGVTFTQLSGGNTTYSFYVDSGTVTGTGTVAYSRSGNTNQNLKLGYSVIFTQGADAKFAYWFTCTEVVSGANMALAKASATPQSVCGTPVTMWTMASGSGGLVNAVTPGTYDLTIVGAVTDSSSDNPPIVGPKIMRSIKP